MNRVFHHGTIIAHGSRLSYDRASGTHFRRIPPLAGSGSLCDLRRAQTASNRTVLAGNPAMGLTLTLWALLATLAAAQDFCPKPGQRCRVAQDIVIVVDVHDVLNSHLQSFIELLQLESTDSRVALVKVGNIPGMNCNIPSDCASVVGAGFSRDTATLTSQMALLSSGDAACPSCGLEIALQILQSGSGGISAFGGRAGIASTIMLVSTPANVYFNGPLEEDPMFIAAATAGDTRVRPPRQPLRPHPFAAATTLDCSRPPLLTHPPHAITD